MPGAALTAVDIGSYQTKLTTGHWRGKNLAVGESVVVPTPKGVVADGYIARAGQLGDYLREVLRGIGVRRGQALFTIDSTQMIMRELELPHAKDDQLRTMVSYEVAKHFPIRVEDYVTDFQHIEDFVDGDTKKARLLVAAIPKEMEESYWGLATAIGLKPACLEMQPVSIARLLANGAKVNGVKASPSATWAVVDIGHSKLNVSIVRGGKLSLTKTVAAGGLSIDQALSLSFDASVDQVREMKHLASLFPPEDGEETAEMAQARSVIQAGVDEWVREIQPVFRYYLGQAEGNQIDGILLHGGSSQIRGLTQYVQEVFNRPAELWGPSTDGPFQLHPSAANQSFLTGIGALMWTSRGGNNG